MRPTLSAQGLRFAAVLAVVVAAATAGCGRSGSVGTAGTAPSNQSVGTGSAENHTPRPKPAHVSDLCKLFSTAEVMGATGQNVSFVEPWLSGEVSTFPTEPNDVGSCLWKGGPTNGPLLQLRITNSSSPAEAGGWKQWRAEDSRSISPPCDPGHGFELTEAGNPYAETSLQLRCERGAFYIELDIEAEPRSGMTLLDKVLKNVS